MSDHDNSMNSRLRQMAGYGPAEQPAPETPPRPPPAGRAQGASEAHGVPAPDTPGRMNQRLRRAAGLDRFIGPID